MLLSLGYHGAADDVYNGASQGTVGYGLRCAERWPGTRIECEHRDEGIVAEVSRLNGFDGGRNLPEAGRIHTVTGSIDSEQALVLWRAEN